MFRVRNDAEIKTAKEFHPSPFLWNSFA